MFAAVTVNVMVCDPLGAGWLGVLPPPDEDVPLPHPVKKIIMAASVANARRRRRGMNSKMSNPMDASQAVLRS